MNKATRDFIKTAFDLACNSAAKFDEQVKSTFTHYRDAREQAKNRAAAFKDEKAEFARLMEEPTAQARAELREADAEFSDTLRNTVIPRLREGLAEHVTAAPPKDFLDALRVYREFGLKPSKLELETLIHASEGNYTGLRALQTVARENGFDIRFDDLASYEGDIKELEKLSRTPTCYAPLSFTHEADEIFKERPVFRPDGSVAYNAPSSTISAILTAQEYSGGFKHIAEAKEKWATNIVPSIVAYQPVKDEETGETISPAEQRREDIDAAAKVATVDNDPTMMGHKLGEQRANEAKEANRILKYYVNKPAAGGDS